MKNRSGFTLMELMIAVAIVSILAAIATPNIIRWRSNSRFNSALREVQSTINAMRIKSLKENSRTWIWFDVGTDRYYTWEWHRATDQWDFKRNDLPPGVDLVSANIAGSDWLIYNGRGLPNGAGTLVLSNQTGVSRRIVIPITGNPRIAG